MLHVAADCDCHGRVRSEHKNSDSKVLRTRNLAGANRSSSTKRASAFSMML